MNSAQRPREPREQPTAWAAALRLLCYKARTRRELAARLADKGHEAGEIEATLERLAGLGLINDEEYARDYAETAARHKQWGPGRIEAELRRRGIERELASHAALGAFAECGEIELAFIAARKRPGAAGESRDAASGRRLLAFLLRRGFSRGAALAVLKGLRTA